MKNLTVYIKEKKTQLVRSLLFQLYTKKIHHILKIENIENAKRL